MSLAINTAFTEFIVEGSEFLQERTVKFGSFKRTDRVYKGKIQRRKMLANRPGYVIRGGKLKRMSPIENRHRHFAQLRAAKKRKSKVKQALRKRKISVRRGKSQGFYKK